MDFEEEEEEEEGNEEGWVLEPQEGVVGSMEGPDDSEVTFALHSGRTLKRSIINSGCIRASHARCVLSIKGRRDGETLALLWRNSQVEGSVMEWRRAWLLESFEESVFKSYLCYLPI